MLDWRRFGLSERECMHQLYSGVSYQQLFFVKRYSEVEKRIIKCLATAAFRRLCLFYKMCDPHVSLCHVSYIFVSCMSVSCIMYLRLCSDAPSTVRIAIAIALRHHKV